MPCPIEPGIWAQRDKSLDAKPGRVALMLIQDGPALEPRRAGGLRGVLGLGSRQQRMDGPPEEKAGTAAT